MKGKSFTLTLLLLLSNGKLSSQITNSSILQELRAEIISTDKNESKLLTDVGFNTFIQKKALNYLTGASDLSLAKFYASYNSDNDKLNVGFNIPATNPYTKRLSFIINPILEADIKNSFATLYKDGAWKNNIRGGMKVTYLIPFSTINYWKETSVKDRKPDFQIVRTKKFLEIEKKLNEETISTTQPTTLLDGKTVVNPTNQPISERKMRKKRNESFESIGAAEAEYLEKEGAYTWFQTAWLSGWTFFPITNSDNYISLNNSQPFEKRKFNLWELNLQFTYLYDNKNIGTFYLSPWFKYSQNNSANANLMTVVDYGQYSQFPGSNPENLALLETNKAYLGEYREFKTTSFNFQIVYITPLQNTLIKPGLSFRYEKNWGFYSPTNLRFGIPLNIRGKEKPINIELQYRIDDTSNYRVAADYKSMKSIGISVGLPISLMYK
ncbi:hypothetical protein [Chryseobacterium sp.]|uniref:hypothetical protein n=1 Tax=Chryseobacterium sp. TaxID=1871047 RepID=UPI0035C70D41